MSRLKPWSGHIEIVKDTGQVESGSNNAQAARISRHTKIERKYHRVLLTVWAFDSHGRRVESDFVHLRKKTATGEKTSRRRWHHLSGEPPPLAAAG